MKITNDNIKKYVLFGFLGLIVLFIIGAVTIVLMPFALLYAVGYLLFLVYLFVWYIKNCPAETKQTFAEIAEYCCDPEVIRDYSVRRNRKAAAKRRKKQIKRRKRQARRLVLIHAANKSFRELLN